MSESHEEKKDAVERQFDRIQNEWTHMEQAGLVTPRSAGKALPLLFSGQNSGWSVVAVNDNIEKEMEPVYEDDGHVRMEETDYRKRTITISLLETTGSYLSDGVDGCADPGNPADSKPPEPMDTDLGQGDPDFEVD